MPDEPTAIDPGRWAARLAELAGRHGVPGAQFGVLRLAPDGREEAFTVAHGVLDTDTGHPVTARSAFQIGSITKLWTAAVVMGLVEEGLLTVDTPVAEVLPEAVPSDGATTAGVTVRHLLTHTSGIEGDLFTDTGRGDDAVEKYTALLAGAARIHPLGATFSYCNSGFVLLGRIIERLTGRVWDEAMRERLFVPLGLERTGTLPEEALLNDPAVGHVTGLPEPVRAPRWGLPRSVAPAGGVTADMGDLLRFAAAHLRGGTTADGTRLLSPDTVRAMTEPQVRLPDVRTLGEAWGLGWILYDWDGHRVVGHDGNTVGQSAFLRLLPGSGLAVGLLTNGGRTRDLYQDLYGEVFDALAGVRVPGPVEPPAEPSRTDVSAHTGVYENAAERLEVLAGPDGPVLRTTALGPLAELDPEPFQELPLAAVAPGVYAVRPQGARTWTPVTFYRLETGEEYVHHAGRALPRVASPAE
ncbi:CubicO group peptidase, beta-lactamase class C family [Nocardiopsis flavescens]|uniref:CubicO group peptidase, beta-lactamase class C family n=1 Tax=Nocardiopsis flavescens TaxID=758803 RepID=A0A1M6L8Z1_9ACTN|nr:serine hydrolase domain-containing protein [Nocardiopsis flavescens]SHJ67569.1 CubicO group peptidase, beta-lactamase class C family [Nocardiopsis flavescens]